MKRPSVFPEGLWGPGLPVSSPQSAGAQKDPLRACTCPVSVAGFFPRREGEGERKKQTGQEDASESGWREAMSLAARLQVVVITVVPRPQICRAIISR